MFVVAIVFVMVLTIIYGSYWTLVVRAEEHDEVALRRRLFERRPTRVGAAIVKAAEQLNHLPMLDDLVRRSERIAGPLRRISEQAGSTLTPGAILLAVLSAGVVAGLLA